MKNALTKFEPHADTILRMGLGFVFLWFGWSSITNPSYWSDLVPTWTSFIAEAETLVRLHGIVELVAGLFLFAGIKTRFSAGLLFIVLVHTIILLEPGAIMVRDVGLATALLALTLKK